MMAAAAQPAPAPSDEPAVLATNAAPVIDAGKLQPGDMPDKPGEPVEPAVEDQAPDAPAQPIPAPDEPPPSQESPAPSQDAPKPAAKPAVESPAARTVPAIVPAVYATTNAPGELRLNFRNAPLELVLNYLSDAAGFIIVPETEIKGKVDAWSNQPVSKEEAVDLLNTILNKNGYALLRNGRTLTIVGRDEGPPARHPGPQRQRSRAHPQDRRDGHADHPHPLHQRRPVGAEPAAAAEFDRCVDRERRPATRWVLTDTQMNVRRYGRNHQSHRYGALDRFDHQGPSRSSSPMPNRSSPSLRNCSQPRRPAPRAAGNQGGGGRLFNFMRGGGGGPPGFGGGGDQGGNSGSGGGRAPAPKVLAVADERGNALVVSAPEEQMPIIEDLV